MSTMLKTAAMSLLSKTLQTFLYKYLSDVDVEGVALPSVYDGSGWGVRLSNVKLREGVQLMEQLPGKPRKQRKRPKKKPTTTKKTKTKATTKTKPRTSAGKEENTTSSYREGRAGPDPLDKSSSVHRINAAYGFPDEPPETPPRRRRQDADADASFRRKEEPDEKIMDVSLHDFQNIHNTNDDYDVGNLRPTRSRTASTDDLAVPVDDHPYYDSHDDGEEDDEGGAKSPTTRPATPNQDSKSIFSCFTKGRGGNDKQRQNTGGSTTAAVVDGGGGGDNSTAPTDTTLIGGGEEDASFRSKPPVSVIEQTQMSRQISALAMEETTATNTPRSSTRRGDADGMEESVRTNTIHEQEEEEDESDDDDFEEYEQPYRLCLGDNGRIGTLDIRLIGRELHVMIEDAVLTIEAFPIPESMNVDPTEGEEGDPANPHINGATDTGDAASASSARTAPSYSAPVPPPKTAPPVSSKVEPKRDTVGDRVLADNPLARAIAAIPHLFLRDIRIRFIIRKEPQAQKNEEAATTATTEESTSPVQDTIPTTNQALPGDTMLEVGIEFLSVSSGEDVLSHFQEQNEDESERSEGRNTGDVSTRPPVAAVVSSYPTMETPLDDNEYMIRHIRTGRGPAAGISVQIFAPGPKLPANLMGPSATAGGGVNDFQWARQQWVLATDFHLLRCSGLDLRARIHLGEKKQVAGYSWFYDYEEDEYEYDYYDSTLDSMVLGFDTIAPGPQLPLPPMNPQNMSRGSTPVKPNATRSNGLSDPIMEETISEEQLPAMHPGSEKYTRDANGIQSCKIPSTFHRISRGLHPGSCKDCRHLPSETCSLCWEGPATVKTESTMDTAMPMPGLTLQITLRDPLEINVDRSSVETLHLLKTLFVKKREEEVGTTNDNVTSSEKNPGKTENVASRASSTLDDATKTTASTSSFFGFLSSRTNEPEKEKVVSDAFTESMQPERIQVLGIHFSEAIVRVHVMREERRDEGLSFCYWDLLTSCLAIDYQAFNSDDKISQDVRFDVGYFAWNEIRGVQCKQLVSLGIPANSRDGNGSSTNSVSTTKSLLDDHSRNKSPWPSAACALMDIPPPQETLHFKDRQRHGLQMRFISVKNPLNLMEAVRSMMNVRLGVMTTKVPWGFWRDINDARKQITWGILGHPETPTDPPTPQKQSEEDGRTSRTASSRLTYSVQIDGGSLVMKPLIDVTMPLTRFAGERSSEAGISFETILNKLQVAYGQKAPAKDKALSLQQLATLPENVRSRILFCLDDLKPLEQVLELKPESNPFKRTRAVNKGILKMAKKMSKASKSAHRKNSRRSSSDASTRRQKIMTELMKLDNKELDELWAIHHRHKRKVVKKRADVD